jgi:hypothetical protein
MQRTFFIECVVLELVKCTTGQIKQTDDGERVNDVRVGMRGLTDPFHWLTTARFPSWLTTSFVDRVLMRLRTLPITHSRSVGHLP